VPEVLSKDAIRLGLSAVDKWDAIKQSGALLDELGAVEPGYPAAMLERERSVSTYVGEGVAIPHGTDAARALVRQTTLGVLQFPAGIDWDGQRVTLCVAIAAKGDEHVAVLSALAQILMEPEKAAVLRTSSTVDEVYQMLAVIGESV
jgi:mannitol/fructose-specific phosphotransferase system IIA component